jgi:hypothetical protein
VAAEIGRSLDRLRTEVAEAEAANTALGSIGAGVENGLARAGRRQDVLSRLQSSLKTADTDALTSTRESEPEGGAGQFEAVATGLPTDNL